jgi:hypothetical protein
MTNNNKLKEAFYPLPKLTQGEGQFSNAERIRVENFSSGKSAPSLKLIDREILHRPNLQSKVSKGEKFHLCPSTIMAACLLKVRRSHKLNLRQMSFTRRQSFIKTYFQEYGFNVIQFNSVEDLPQEWYVNFSNVCSHER